MRISFRFFQNTIAESIVLIQDFIVFDVVVAVVFLIFILFSFFNQIHVKIQIDRVAWRLQNFKTQYVELIKSKTVKCNLLRGQCYQWRNLNNDSNASNICHAVEHGLVFTEYIYADSIGFEAFSLLCIRWIYCFFSSYSLFVRLKVSSICLFICFSKCCAMNGGSRNQMKDLID